MVEGLVIFNIGHHAITLGTEDPPEVTSASIRLYGPLHEQILCKVRVCME